MKKFYKMMIFALVFAATMTTALVSPFSFRAADAIVFAAASQKVGATLTIKAMPNEGVVGQALEIPTGEAEEDGVEIVATIKNSVGRVVLTHTKQGENDKKFVFTPSVAGDYYVEYAATKQGVATTTSEKYKIKVVQSTATMEFAENTAFIIPSKVADTDSVVLPIPTVIEEEEVEDLSGLSVIATNPKGQTYALENITIDGEQHKVFKADKDANDVVLTGEYTVKYKYNANGYTATKSYQIQVVKDYVASNNLSYTLASSFPTSAVLGNKLTLPKANVVDKNNNNEAVKVYTVVEVKFAGQAVEVDGKDLSFTPNQKATGADKYNITYKMYDVKALALATKAGKTLEQILAEVEPALTGEYTLTNVEDTEKPTVKVAKAYEVTVAEDVKTIEEELEEELKEKSYLSLMPSVVRVDQQVELPAIYAYDNYSAYNGLKLTRTVKYNGNSYVLENDVVTNENLEYQKTDANALANVTFKKEGAYEVVYRAEDEAGNYSTALTYKITVKEATAKDDVAPYITLPTDIAKSAKVGEKLSFSAPTVVDYELDHAQNPTSFAVVDAYPETKVYAYLGLWTSEMGQADLEEALENEDAVELNLVDGKYEYEIEAGTAELSIVVRAKDHARYLVGGQDNVAFAGKVVNIYSTEDTVAPEFVTNLNDLQQDLNQQGLAGQGTIIALPVLEFVDDGDYRTSVMVVDGNDTRIAVAKDAAQYVFTTASAGEYKVTISATDRGGNSVLATVNFEVKDTVASYIVANSEVESGVSMKLGEEYELQVPTLTKNGKKIDVKYISANGFDEAEDAAVAVDFVSFEQPGDYYFDEITWKFTPYATGTYTFRYLAKDAAGNLAENITAKYSIEVTKSTEEPVISVDENIEVVSYSKYKEDDEFVLVKLPTYNVESANGVSSTELKVTGPQGNNVTVKAYDADDNEIAAEDLVTEIAYYGFEATDGVGLYTVNYKAVDKEGLSATKTYNIKIGDTLAPEMTGLNDPSTKNWKVGNELSINLKDITISDYNDVDEDATVVKGNIAINNTTGIRLTLTLTGPNGTVSTSSTEDSVYVYNLENSGDYTLKYLAKDAAGNETEKVYSFTVKAEEQSTVSAEKAWGIALIVLSVAILAGVIIYFVRTKDVDATNLPTKKDDKKDNK